MGKILCRCHTDRPCCYWGIVCLSSLKCVVGFISCVHILVQTKRVVYVDPDDVGIHSPNVDEVCDVFAVSCSVCLFILFCRFLCLIFLFCQCDRPGNSTVTIVDGLWPGQPSFDFHWDLQCVTKKPDPWYLVSWLQHSWFSINNLWCTESTF